MDFIKQLRALKLYKPEMDILDIGCRNGWLYDTLVAPKLGRYYEGIDVTDLISDKNKERFHFQQISFADFVPQKSYDLIFANDVLFFDPDQIGQATRYANYLKPQGIMCVSFMFNDDPHVGKNGIDGSTWYGASRDAIESFKQGFEVLWADELQGKYSDLGGTLREWHVYQMIIRKK